jgi:membrane protease YdiL (CAAX protease family)
MEKRRTNLPNKKMIALFFLLAYAISWAFFIPRALSVQKVIALEIPPIIHFLGAYGPMIAAFIVIGIANGWEGIRELIGRIFRWRIGLPWLLIAAFSPVALFFVSLVVNRILVGNWQGIHQFGFLPEYPGLSWYVGWLVWIFTFGLGEEIGWRGYALPALQWDRSARSATLILGLFWAFWHTPTFFYNYELSLFSVIAFIVSILSGAVVLTWLYNSTRGSLLAVILWHGSFNTVVAGAGGTISILVSAIIIAGAVVIGNVFGPETFSHRGKQTI